MSVVAELSIAPPQPVYKREGGFDAYCDWFDGLFTLLQPKAQASDFDEDDRERIRKGASSLHAVINELSPVDIVKQLRFTKASEIPDYLPQLLKYYSRLNQLPDEDQAERRVKFEQLLLVLKKIYNDDSNNSNPLFVQSPIYNRLIAIYEALPFSYNSTSSAMSLNDDFTFLASPPEPQPETSHRYTIPLEYSQHELKTALIKAWCSCPDKNLLLFLKAKLTKDPNFLKGLNAEEINSIAKKLVENTTVNREQLIKLTKTPLQQNYKEAQGFIAALKQELEQV